MPGYGGGNPADMSTFVLEITITDPQGKSLVIPDRVKDFTEREAHEYVKKPFTHAIEQGYRINVDTKQKILPDPNDSRYARV